MQPVGNLAVFEPRDVHEERYAVISRQAVHDTVNLFSVVAVVCNVIAEILLLVKMIKIVGVVYECLVTHLLAVVVYKDVAHDCVYPPFEIRVGRVLVHVSECFKRGFLQ